MIVVDTSAILAYMNSADTHHAAVRAWLAAEEDDLATTPLIVAEADHLVAAHGGRAALTALRGAFPDAIDFSIEDRQLDIERQNRLDRQRRGLR